MWIRVRRSSLLALLLAAPAAAQGQVWVVDDQAGPGVDFTSIQAAVDASSDGDTVLVRAGSYAETVAIVARALALIADTGADVQVQGGLHVSGTQASQAVLLRGMRVPGNWPAYPYGLVVHQAAGPVWVEDCTLRGSHSFGGAGLGATVSNSAGVAILRCTLRGGSGTGKASPGPGGTGLVALSPVHAFDSSVRGGDAPPIAGIPFFGLTGAGGAGAMIYGTALFSSGTQFEGGTGSSGYAHPTLGCVGGGAGGAGVGGLGFGTAFVTVATSAVGGSGGTAFGACGVGASGSTTQLPAGALQALPGAAHGAVFASPIREGQAISGSVQGLPNEFALLAFNSVPQPGVIAVGLSGVVLLAPPVALLGLGSIPGSGSLSIAATAGSLAPGTESGTLFLEPAFVDPSGPTAVLGAPATLTLLHAGL